MTTNETSGVPGEDPHRISSQEEAKYAHMFQKLGAEDRYLNGKRAVVLLGKSGLPQETLAKVWTLADSDCDGRLCVKVKIEADDTLL